MMTMCINPDCSQPFGSFSEGRLFQFEIVSISVSADDNQKKEFDELPTREKAHFWLCGACSVKMRLSLEPLEGLRFLPVERTLEPSMPAVNQAFKANRSRDASIAPLLSV